MNQPGVQSSEGRAITARPSLLLVLLVAVGTLILAPAAAQADPPALIGTTPVSPNIDLAPFVRGNSSGVIISSVPFARTSAAHTAAGEEATIDIFESKNCEGTPAASGTASQFDNAGIQISVEAETTTYISAERVDLGGPSGCSTKWIEYVHVKELPPPKEEPPVQPPANPPVVQPAIAGRPLGLTRRPRRICARFPVVWANDNTPLVTGSAPGAASVRIFTRDDCSGSPVAKGSAAQFDAGLEVQVADNAIVAFYGTSVGPGGAQSRCSAPVYYVEDSLTPHTRITMGPASKTRKRNAVFRFADTTGDAPGTTFFCKFDRRKWKQCSSPLKLKRLPLKRHVLKVKAIDPAGNAETKPAKRASRSSRLCRRTPGAQRRPLSRIELPPVAGIVLFAFVLGLVAGSFVTAVAHRVPRGISIAAARSECPACGAQIAAYDNIPVLSWVLLRGRARCCGARISPRYPLTELVLGLLFALTVAIQWGDTVAEVAIDLVFLTMLAAVTLTDLEQRIIPNKILLVGAILCLAIAAPTDPSGLPERVVAATIAGGLLFLVVLAYPKGMGLGDVKLTATMGLFLGWAVAPAILVALFAGSFVGLAMIARHGADARKMAIPFGPFLALGGVVGMLVGNRLIDLYLG